MTLCGLRRLLAKHEKSAPDEILKTTAEGNLAILLELCDPHMTSTQRNVVEKNANDYVEQNT